ncbi:DNA-3-methyladenine glycosylase 2 [Candidatus Hepatincola sp. Av]
MNSTMFYSIELPLPKSYQFNYWLSCNEKRAITNIEQVIGSSYYRRSWFNKDVFCKISFKDNNCIVELHGIKLNQEEEKWLLQKITVMLGFEVNYKTINNHFQFIEGFKEIYNNDLCIPIQKSWGIYEAIIRAIMSQLVTTKAANTMLNNFFNLLLQTKKDINNFKHYFVLSPQLLDISKLKSITCFSKQKQRAIVEVTNIFLETPTLEDKIFTYEEIQELLLPIKGIGKWTCASVALRNTVDNNIFIENDYSINKWLQKHNLNVDNIKNKVQPYSSYFSNYIWFLLEQHS